MRWRAKSSGPRSKKKLEGSGAVPILVVMQTRHHPRRPIPSGRCPRSGFTLVEFLLVAFILAVGLLGLGAMQVATVRGGAGAETRLTAATLANNTLEEILAEARQVFLARRGQDAPWPVALKYTVPGPGPWVLRFARDGQPATAQSAFFTVAVTRSTPGGHASQDAFAAAREFQSTVAWMEGTPPVPRALTLTRLITY
jgi:prepilin-type N-terminal cleavage/methylation domain-containing protein